MIHARELVAKIGKQRCLCFLSLPSTASALLSEEWILLENLMQFKNLLSEGHVAFQSYLLSHPHHVQVQSQVLVDKVPDVLQKKPQGT